MHVDLEKQPWRFRFSLRSLFVLTAIVCLALWFIPRYLEWAEYRQFKQSVFRSVERLKILPTPTSPGDFEFVVYNNQPFCLSTNESVFRQGVGLFLGPQVPRDMKTFPKDLIFVSPPDIWVQPDSDVVMALIVKTHAAPKKQLRPQASPPSPTSPLSPSITKNVKPKTH